MTKPAVVYIRVSTARQGRSGLGLEAQETAILRFCEAEGYEVVAQHLEVETGKGADALDRRPELAAALAEDDSADCLDQQTPGTDTLISRETDFYILGAKSYGRSSNFLLSVGLEQIRQIFTIIGDSSDLDLYRSVTAMKTSDMTLSDTKDSPR